MTDTVCPLRLSLRVKKKKQTNQKKNMYKGKELESHEICSAATLVKDH